MEELAVGLDVVGARVEHGPGAVVACCVCWGDLQVLCWGDLHVLCLGDLELEDAGLVVPFSSEKPNSKSCIRWQQ